MLMKVFERYFSRNPVSRQLSFEADTAVIVIIPVFNDPDIFADPGFTLLLFGDEYQGGCFDCSEP